MPKWIHLLTFAVVPLCALEALCPQACWRKIAGSLGKVWYLNRGNERMIKQEFAESLGSFNVTFVRKAEGGPGGGGGIEYV